MKPKVSAFIATSLDGFIARKDGGLDWLTGETEPGGPDYGYREFMNSVDVLVMGRKSFEKVLTFDKWPYGDQQVVVLSSNPCLIPSSLRDTVTSLSLSPQDLVDYFSARGATHLYIDGGLTIQRFITAGLIDEIIITIIPVLIGDGISLFGTLDKDVKLTHIATEHFESGYVQSKYGFTKVETD